MVNHAMTKGMAATERTVEDALAHADSIKQWMKDNPTVPDMPLPDYHLVLLAEEVRRLRDDVDGLRFNNGVLMDQCEALDARVRKLGDEAKRLQVAKPNDVSIGEEWSCAYCGEWHMFTGTLLCPNYEAVSDRR